MVPIFFLIEVFSSMVTKSIFKLGALCLIALALGTLQGCKESNNLMFGPYQIDVTTNEFDGYKIYRMHSNILLYEEPNMQLDEMFRPIPVSATNFLLEKVVTKDSEKIAVVLEHGSPKWLFIRKDADLKIIFKDQNDQEKTITLLPIANSKTEEVTRGGVYETIKYTIAVDQIKALSEAKSAKLRIVGKNDFVVRYFYFVNIQYLKNFLEEPFVKGEK